MNDIYDIKDMFIAFWITRFLLHIVFFIVLLYVLDEIWSFYKKRNKKNLQIQSINDWSELENSINEFEKKIFKLQESMHSYSKEVFYSKVSELFRKMVWVQTWQDLLSKTLLELDLLWLDKNLIQTYKTIYYNQFDPASLDEQSYRRQCIELLNSILEHIKKDKFSK